MNISQLLEYCERVVAARESSRPHLLPQAAGSGRVDHDEEIATDCLLDYATIAECMKESGKDIMGMIPLQVIIFVVFFYYFLV